MSNYIEFLEAVYERMHQVGLAESKADFSSRMLGKAASYLTSTKARHRQVPEEVIDFLKRQLETDISSEGIALISLQEEADRQALRQKHRVDLLSWIDRHRGMSDDPVPSAQALPPKPVSLRPGLFHMFRFSRPDRNHQI